MIDFDRAVESRRRLPFAKVPCARSNGGEDLLPPLPTPRCETLFIVLLMKHDRHQCPCRVRYRLRDAHSNLKLIAPTILWVRMSNQFLCFVTPPVRALRLLPALLASFSHSFSN